MLTEIISLILAFYILFWLSKKLIRIIKAIIEHISVFISGCKKKKPVKPVSKVISNDPPDLPDNKSPYEN